MSHKRDISTTTGENRCHGDKAPPAVFSCQRKRSLIRKTSSLAYRNHALGLVADWRQNNPQKSWSQWLLRLPPAESHQALRFRLSIITRHDRFEDRTRGQGKGARKVLKYGRRAKEPGRVHVTKRFLQWNLSFGTPQFKGHKIWSQKNVQIIFVVVTQATEGTPPSREHKMWSRKNVHVIFVFVTSIEGTPLFRGKAQLFLVPP